MSTTVDRDAEAPSTFVAQRNRSAPINRWKDVLGLAWVLAAALAVLAPLLVHGRSFGEFDSLSQFGVLAQHGVALHNSQAGDQTDAIIPWTTLVWTQVHQGHIPLWNPYGALGMPLTFNWQAATFSLPSLISYLFPLSISSTIQVVLTLFIAGSGTYFLARVLRLSVVASAFAATVFELSGPMMGWLGWIHGSAMAYAGWIFAFIVLVLRGTHRLRSITLLSVSIAAMVFAGSPEMLVMLGLAAAIFVLVVLAIHWRLGEQPRNVLRTLGDLFVAGVGGAMLSAPLLLPGLQLISVSQRGVSGGDPAELLPGNPPLPAHNLIHFVFQGYDGLPIAGSKWFGYTLGYSETAAYVGLIALALAVTVVAVKRHRPVVLGFAAMTLVLVAIAFVPFVTDALSRAPAIGTVLWQRAIFPAAFGLALLGGFGLDALVSKPSERRALVWAFGSFVAGTALVALLWLFGRGHLPPEEADIRSHSFVWPAVQSLVGLVAVGALLAGRRRTTTPAGNLPDRDVGLRRAVGIALLLVESAFLVVSGASLWTSSSDFFPSTPAEASLKQLAGSSLVGFGAPLCFFPPGLGIEPNAQLAYGIDEFALYDPMIPNGYFSAWREQTHSYDGNANDSAYCPVVKTVAQARLYGVGLVLERRGTPGPSGTRAVANLGDETAYRVSDSGPASLVALPSAGPRPGIYAAGTQVPVSHSDPASWTVHTEAKVPSSLRLRLTDVPGWHATIDGRPVPLQQFAGVMLQVDVPAGRHVVELHYWPSAFTHGIILAGVAVIGFVIAWVIAGRRRASPSDRAGVLNQG